MVGETRRKRGSGHIIDPRQVDTTVTLIAGVDAGSTETRVCLADDADVRLFSSQEATEEALNALEVQYCIPSTYANVEDAREISPQSESLEDNLDTTVMLIGNSTERPLISRCRVIRGRKIQDAMGCIPRYLDSSTNKTDNVIFYVNIIDALGYAIMQKYNGQIPKQVDVKLTLSVRPKELTTVCKERMHDNLVGEYMFKWKNVDIRMRISSLNFSTEPEAQISGTMAVYDMRAAVREDADSLGAVANKLYDSDCYAHIEGGGSSIGVEVVKNGRLIAAASATFPLGGNYMAQLFIDRYREQSGRTVTKEAANNAIITCVLRDGRNTLDVSGLVAECKNQVALDIAERLRHEVIDTTSMLTMHDLEFISLGGRLFSRDACDGAIGDYFDQYIKQLSQNTEVIVLPENFIAQGNLTFGLNSEDNDSFDEEDGAEEMPAPYGGINNDAPVATTIPADFSFYSGDATSEAEDD